MRHCNLGFRIETFNLNLLIVSYVPHASSFILTQLFVLNLDGPFDALSINPNLGGLFRGSF